MITWGERGWNTTQLPALLVVLLCMGLFLIIEWKNPTPMLPLTLFKTQAFSISSIVGFCLNFSFFGQLFVLSLYFQKYLGWSPWIAGLAMVPQATSAIVASPLGGRFSAKFNPYSAMFVGLSVGGTRFLKPGCYQREHALCSGCAANILCRFRNGIRYAGCNLSGN